MCALDYKPALVCFLDFTALLVDIIGNSTSYLTEIFKSTSILSGLHVFVSPCTIHCWCTRQACYNPHWDTGIEKPRIRTPSSALPK